MSASTLQFTSNDDVAIFFLTRKRIGFKGKGRLPQTSTRPGPRSPLLIDTGLKNPFAKIDPPIQKKPKICDLLLADIRRLLDYLKARQQR